MTADDAIDLVQQFNGRINARDADGLAALMAEDHTFIDAAGGTVSGKAAALESWRGFFEQFPDYQNIFERLDCKDDLVTVLGRSTCGDERLAGPALWSARVRAGLVTEWRIYLDTPESRAALAIE